MTDYQHVVGGGGGDNSHPQNFYPHCLNLKKTFYIAPFIKKNDILSTIK